MQSVWRGAGGLGLGHLETFGTRMCVCARMCESAELCVRRYVCVYAADRPAGVNCICVEHKREAWA